MSGVATAIAVTGLAGAAVASKAGKAQSKASGDANAIAQQQFEQTRADNAGYRARGDAAGNYLAMLLGLDVGPTEQETRAANAKWQTVDNFDAARYLRENPDVAASGKDPFTHWIQAGQFEDRQFPATAAAQAEQDALKVRQAQAAATTPKNALFGSLLRPWTPAGIEQDAGYQFNLAEGTKALDNSAAARGNLYSGAQMKAAQKFGQGLANTYANDYFNRDAAQKDRTFNYLSGISGTGQAATNQVSAAGQNYANMFGQNVTAGANARASGMVGAANSLSNGLGTWLNYSNQQNLLKTIGTNANASNWAGFGGTASSPWYG